VKILSDSCGENYNAVNNFGYTPNLGSDKIPANLHLHLSLNFF